MTNLSKQIRTGKPYYTYPSENPPSNKPMPLVSVIVPIYNAEPYLDQALSSIERQTYKNLEIICLNDGSTDDSPKTIKEHASKDSRIVVIDKANEGYGATCNRGIGESHGDWVAIVEPDDWIEQGMFKAMIEFAQLFDSVDIIKTPYLQALDRKGRLRITDCSYRCLVKPKKQPFQIQDEPELIKNHPSIWSALYRREFLNEKNIRFKEIPGAGWADNPFLIESMCQADSIIWLDEPYYVYRNDTQAQLEAFHKSNYRIPFKRWDEMMDIIESLGITDERILMGHYNRGFVYSAGVLEYNDPNNPEIKKLLKGMFERMDAQIVLGSESVSPGTKRLFAGIMNIPCPKTSKLSYIKRLSTSAIATLKSAGPKDTALEIAHYLTSHKKRTGGK